MFGLMEYYIEQWQDKTKSEIAAMNRRFYDAIMARGPMIEADIDWREPRPYRPMLESDL